MSRFLSLGLALAFSAAAPAAFAATTIVNLSSTPPTPNSGNSSPGFPYNPVNVSLAAGTYTVRVAGLAGGGIYDAFSLYAPSAGSAAWTDAKWSVSLNGGASAAYTQGDVGGTVADYDGQFKAGRYNTAAAAAAVYSAAPGYTFTLASAQSVAFYVDDSGSPYFGDDTGGVSLSIAAVPEPAALALFGVGAVGLMFVRRRRPGVAAA